MKYPILFALLTALFWGLYGPSLGQARSALLSPFKPYLFVGLAYLFWGVGGGILGMLYKGDSFAVSGPGALWGFVAGSVGALGAFTLTLAMFSGGAAMPQVVMPVVFGGAVTVTALTEVFVKGAARQTSPWLWIGVVGVFISILLVAYNTPHAPHKAPAAQEVTTE